MDHNDQPYTPTLQSRLYAELWQQLEYLESTLNGLQHTVTAMWNEAVATPLMQPRSVEASSGRLPAKGPMHPYYPSLFSTTPITLIVGGPFSPAREPYPIKFYIHEYLLVCSSTVFRVMLGRSQPQRNDIDAAEDENLPAPWTEARTKVIYLPEDRVADWTMLNRWLYSNGEHMKGLNVLSDTSVEKYRGPELLWKMIETQPGLNCSELQTDVWENLQWREARKRSALNEPNTIGTSQNSTAAAASKKTHVASAGSEKMTLSRVPNPTAESPPRPMPPKFGPLIRLYILADKYAVSEHEPMQIPSHPGSESFQYIGETPITLGMVDTSLKSQITLRIRAINKLVHAVPDREDIERLWADVPLSCEKDPLKKEIVQMFASIDQNALKGILCRQGWGEWSAEFLRDLVVAQAARAQSKQTPNGENAEKGAG